jgi:hypothetical protein
MRVARWWSCLGIGPPTSKVRSWLTRTLCWKCDRQSSIAGLDVNRRRLLRKRASAFKNLNERFQVELRRFQGSARPRRGTAWTNPERAINQARSSRTAKPITFSNTRQVMYLNRFAQGARIAGRGLLVLDAGIRANKVRQVYNQGGDWLRTATVETVGMTFGFGAGVITTYAATMLLAATPVGWVVLVAAGIGAGYLAATKADDLGKEIAGKIYDRF